MAIQFIENVRRDAKKVNKLVAFPDATDKRTIQACRILADEGIARPALVGAEKEIREAAEAFGVSIDGVQIFDPAASADLQKYAQTLYEKRKKKGMTEEEAEKTMRNPLFFAGMLLENAVVDVVVAGNVSSTGDVLRASIFTVGVAPGVSIVSSYFIMAFEDRMLCFADCAVNPNPDSKQLADIAITTAKNFQAVTGQESRVALLSFSTNGSAEHELVDKVREAAQIVKEKAPEIPSDGEMQLDAAIIPSIGERKFPGSKVAGKANVLVFPDLNAGNIGYKLVERLAGALAVGPIIQGLNKPYCDLSRGCSADDMVNVAAICSLMA
ncbi:MAG: phosphate acetyltransferase [Chloroflexota bacterium]